jgi:DNA-binding NarL/FixJ family response regulator
MLSEEFPYISSDILWQAPHNLGVAIASVLLVEDDVFSRSTLGAALVGSNIEVKGQVAKASEAIRAVTRFSIDIAIVDLDLGPGANGIDVAIALRDINPRIGIIILTSYSDPRVANPNSLSLPKGSRFLTKSSLNDFSVLIQVILELKNQPLSNKNGSKIERVELSENQLSVLQGVAEGLTTKEIANRAGVSEKAIEGTITRLHAMLELPKKPFLNPRVQLARAYFQLSGKKPPGV